MQAHRCICRETEAKSSKGSLPQEQNDRKRPKSLHVFLTESRLQCNRQQSEEATEHSARAPFSTAAQQPTKCLNGQNRHQLHQVSGKSSLLSVRMRLLFCFSVSERFSLENFPLFPKHLYIINKKIYKSVNVRLVAAFELTRNLPCYLLFSLKVG